MWVVGVSCSDLYSIPVSDSCCEWGENRHNPNLHAKTCGVLMKPGDVQVK